MIILAGNRFFRIFGKTGPRIRNFFTLKPSLDQDGANKKRFSQISPAVPELLSFRQTHIHTDRQTKTLNTFYYGYYCEIHCSVPGTNFSNHLCIDSTLEKEKLSLL